MNLYYTSASTSLIDGYSLIFLFAITIFMEKPFSNTKLILLADDDEDDVYLFRNAVWDLHKDIKIVIASNGIVCMELLANSPLPDVVFLDINMPLKSGFDCLEEIRMSERLKHLKVVVLSTSNSENTISMAYAKGADLYVPKATTYDEFKSLLARCLAQLKGI